MIEVDYNGSTYLYNKELGSRPWVNAKTKVAVPVNLYAKLRQTAISDGVDAKTFTTSGTKSNTTKKKPAKNSSFIKIF